MKANTVISWVTALLVLFLAGAAFVLSYDALHSLALANGIKASLAWLWPLTLDAFMIAASLAVLRGSLYKERILYPWVLVGAFTVASIVFNVLHANADWLPRAIAALPPAVVFLSFELLMSQTKVTVTRQSHILSIADLTAEAETKQHDITALDTEIEKLTGKRDRLQDDITALKAEKRQAVPATSDDTKRQAIAILAERTAQGDDISGAELGRMLGRSEGLGRKLKRELLPLVEVSGNGNSSD